MIGWTWLNYVPMMILVVMISILATVAVSYFKHKKDNELMAAFSMLLIVVLGLWGLFGLAAAPLGSSMERVYWAAEFQADPDALTVGATDEQLAEIRQQAELRKKQLVLQNLEMAGAVPTCGDLVQVDEHTYKTHCDMELSFK